MISIIIPIYNSAKSLPNCLKSIENQTFKDIEVIMVNDGSSDTTEDICKSFVDKDSRFKYFYIENSGVSKARNFGIEKSNGEWVTFVDSDDWIESDMIAFMVSKASANIDIVGVKPIFDKCGKTVLASLNRNFIHKKDLASFPLTILVPEASVYYDNVVVSLEVMASVWGKMIRKKILKDNNIRFKESLPLGEDGLFWLQCYLKCKDFVFYDKNAYHYVMSESSSNYKYRSNILEINQKYYSSYMDELDKIPFSFRNEYQTLLVYRSYCNLRNLYLFHKDNSCSFQNRLKVLEKMLANNRVCNIPYLAASKKVEIALIKKKCYILLFLFGKMISIIKDFLK